MKTETNSAATIKIMAAQESRKTVLLVDLARVFDLAAAASAGVNVEALLVSTPDETLQAVEIAETVIRSGVAEVVVFFGTLGIRQTASLRALCAGNGVDLHHVEAERAPTPKTTAEMEAELTADIRSVTRRAKSLSANQRLAARAETLIGCDASRPAHYALAWAISTGRLSSEMRTALLAMPAAAFARAALKIAADLGGSGVSEIYEAWRVLAIDQCQTSARAA